MTTVFHAAQAPAGHWGLAVKTALDGLGQLPDDANFGIVYVTESLAGDLASIVTFLRETTPVASWLAAAGQAVLGPVGASGEKPALALMAGHVVEDRIRMFQGPDPARVGEFASRHGAWLASQHSVFALAHADPRETMLEEKIGLLTGAGPIHVFGGLAVSTEMFPGSSGAPVPGGLSGALFGDGVEILIGVSQGCYPIGAPHVVTEVVDNVVMTLDGEPALSHLKTEAGEVIARDLKRAAGFIHVARPVGDADDPLAYQVRSLVAIDPVRGWLAVAEKLEKGDRLMFVRRDANTAQRDMRRMLKGMAEKLQGRAVRGGIYISCVARGAHMFGSDDREREMILGALGDFPLIGFSALGEICRDRVLGFTGVLALFV